MSERSQDQRPVFMGTFIKQNRFFEHKVNCVESEVSNLLKKQTTLISRLTKTEKAIKYIKIAVITLGVIALAMLMPFIFS